MRNAPIILALIAFIVIVTASPLLFTTMNVEGPAYEGNCGTIFASGDSWTYSSPYAARPELDKAAIWKGDTTSAVTSALDEMQANWQSGIDAGEACEKAHAGRRIVLIAVGVCVVAVIGTASWLGVRARREKAVS
ncbi:hypothetical protein [Nocardia sp. NPDC003963]